MAMFLCARNATQMRQQKQVQVFLIPWLEFRQLKIEQGRLAVGERGKNRVLEPACS